MQAYLKLQINYTRFKSPHVWQRLDDLDIKSVVQDLTARLDLVKTE